jgi:hypothetical protein
MKPADYIQIANIIILPAVMIWSEINLQKNAIN